MDDKDGDEGKELRAGGKSAKDYAGRAAASFCRMVELCLGRSSADSGRDFSPNRRKIPRPL
ncbi:hypothetical protein HMPREF1986_00898 [Oribacterium sp. oral taxon 078 str. F0263]|nr:hypothetical protein HMPREF1986_00898 [Oribacterium sp. oral taxon 078 str. F0263]